MMFGKSNEGMRLPKASETFHGLGQSLLHAEPAGLLVLDKITSKSDTYATFVRFSCRFSVQ